MLFTQQHSRQSNRFLLLHVIEYHIRVYIEVEFPPLPRSSVFANHAEQDECGRDVMDIQTRILGNLRAEKAL